MMLLADALAAEFSYESESTKKLLARLPEDKLSWKPHRKSMSLGRLGTHLAEIPEWAKTIMEEDSYDMGAVDPNRKPLELESRQEIIDLFQKKAVRFAEIVKGKGDDLMLASWKLKQGDEVLLDLRRVVALRSFVLSHSIHHRGQLTVYLRLNDVPLPGIYGPSADEG